MRSLSSQEEDIDYTEIFAPIVRLEALRIFLSFVAHHKLILYRMNVKNTFLNGFINELVYVKQPSGFEDMKFQIMFSNTKRR